jgi:hypothetical protein
MPDSTAKTGFTWALVPLVVKGRVDGATGSFPPIPAKVVLVAGAVVATWAVIPG